MTIIFFTALAVVCYFIYQQIKLPEGVSPMNGDMPTIDPWLVYWGGCASILAVFIGLIREVVGLIRDERNRNAKNSNEISSDV